MTIQFPGSLSSLERIPINGEEQIQLEIALRASLVGKIFAFIFSRMVPKPLSWESFVHTQNSEAFILQAITNMNNLRYIWISPLAEAPYRFSGSEETLKCLQNKSIKLQRFPDIEKNISFVNIADLMRKFLNEVDKDISENAQNALIIHFVDVLENTLYYQSQHSSPVKIFMDNFPELKNPHIRISSTLLSIYFRK